MIRQNTILLDQAAWDMVLDSSGNIALAGSPYSIAQDVASVVRTFIGECPFDTSLGIPYWQQIIGRFPPLNFVAKKIQDEALKVPNVVTAKVSFTNFSNRNLSGQIVITDIDSITQTVSF